MSHIEFRPLQSTLILGVGQDSVTSSEERIHMTAVVKLSPWETLELEDGTSMEGKAWSLGFSRKEKGQVSDQVSDQEAEHIGYIHYMEPFEDERFGRPETFYVEIDLDDREYESLLTSVRTRKATPQICVGVSGLDFGLSPDGDDVIWRNKTSPNLPVTSARFAWPLGKFETDDEQSDDDGSLGNTPFSDQSKIPLTVGALRQATDTINKSLRLVAWMIAGLIAAVIFF